MTRPEALSHAALCAELAALRAGIKAAIDRLRAQPADVQSVTVTETLQILEQTLRGER